MTTFNSKEYWENRYMSGSDSGIGSKGILAKYKAYIINQFVKENNIQTVCELGCGDVQFTLYNIPEFTGYDVSSFIIEKNKKIYKHKFTTSIDELTSYDLTMSLDVILHLIEDEVYYQYMKDLFRLSNKYVLIYSPNKNQILGGVHNKYREFLPDVPENFKLLQFINNPHKGEHTQADFFIFKMQ
jgi:hypothetical protein